MTDRNARNERSTERRQAEGVRIIGAEEAQKALEAGQVAGRRSEDELRFGDVPPAPVGPRPSHRFPLPDSVDPAEAVPLAPVAPLRGESPQASRLVRVNERALADAAREARGPADDGVAEGEPASRWTATDEGLTSGKAEEMEPTGPLPMVRPADGPGLQDADPQFQGRLRWAPEASRAAYPGSEADDEPVDAWRAPVPDTSPVDDPETVVWRPETGGGRSGDPAAGPSESVFPTVTGPEDAGGYGYDGGYGSDDADPVGAGLPYTPASSSWNLGERESPWETGTDDDAADPADVATPGADDGWDTAATWAPASAEAGVAWPRHELDDPDDDTRYHPEATYEDADFGGETDDGRAGAVVAGASYDAPGYDQVSEYDTPRWRDEAPDADVPDLAPPEEGITVTGSHVLPHWTEPSEGVPASLLGAEHDESDSEAWNALGAGGARWRGGHDDWDDESASATGFFADEDDQGPRLGALDTDRSDESDLYSFDAAFQQLEEERSGSHPVISVDDTDAAPAMGEPVAATRTGTRVSPGRRVARIGSRARTGPAPKSQAARSGMPRRSPPGGGGGSQDLASRVGVGVGFVVVLIAAYAVGPKALLVLAAAVVLLCAAEAYGVLQRSGFRPATLLGLTATGGLMFASYWRGEPAVPLVVALAFAATMVWYLLGIVEARPLANVAVTSMTMLWVGVLGSFSALMLRVPHGKGLFLGAVVVTVASDIVAYFVGRQLGHRPLAPEVSPGKTVEGLVAGVVAAIVVGLIIGREVTPWGGLRHGLLLGIVVAVFAPVGDLFESLIKRDLDVKDSGTTLGGHGGLLDRFDSLLLVLPAVYYLADYLHLAR